MVKKIFSFVFRINLMVIMFSFLSGCALVTEAIRDKYEDMIVLKKGEPIVQKEKLYALTVPDDYFYMVEGKKGANLNHVRGLQLVPRSYLASMTGGYQVALFPETEIPEPVRNDLAKSFDWINQNPLAKRVGESAVLLLSQEEQFEEKPAQYVEYFLPEKSRQISPTSTRIDRGARVYSAYVFYRNGHLYWIHHDNPVWPVDDQRLNKIREATRSEFKTFMEKFTTNPTTQS